MGKMTISTTKKTTMKRMVKPAAPADGKTVEAPLSVSAEKPAPKARRVRKPALPRTGKPATARRTTTAAKTSRKSKSASTKAAYTSEDIALRAYFISQKRQQLGQYGSPESDWLEAERQLREGLTA
jgi:Protein of unknown function (DUF2934)